MHSMWRDKARRRLHPKWAEERDDKEIRVVPLVQERLCQGMAGQESRLGRARGSQTEIPRGKQRGISRGAADRQTQEVLRESGAKPRDPTGVAGQKPREDRGPDGQAQPTLPGRRAVAILQAWHHA